MQHTLPRGVPTGPHALPQARPWERQRWPVRINRWLHTWVGLATVVAVWRVLLFETVGVGE